MSIKQTKIDTLYVHINYALLVVVFVIMTYPLLLVVSSSFSSYDALSSGRVWLLPVDFTLDGYAAVFQYDMILTGYGNSIGYMLAGTLINLFMTTICAYPLSRSDLLGGRPLLFYFTFTMFFGGGLIPSYLLIRQLGLVNTRWVMLLPGAMSVWNMIVMRTYFKSSISPELLHAAQIDGCTDFGFLVRIVLPLSGPILAVMALFYGVGHWNAYFNAMIYLDDRGLYPLQLVLREILVMNTISMDMLSMDPSGLQLRLQLINVLKYAVIVVANLPLFLAYPFIQRFFVKGVMLGSLKG